MPGFKKLKVAVVGCGTGGPAAATLLARHGHEVVLFERASECRAVGAGFLLQPSGMATLCELGIYEQVRACGARVERLHVVDEHENDFLDLYYAELGDDLFGLGLHRPVLLHYLIEAMDTAGVEVRWGWEVGEAVRESKGWRVESESGEIEDGFDLLIVADGARSTLRAKLGFRGTDRGYPWGAHWFIGKNGGTLPEGELFQMVKGTKRLLGFLPTGREIDGVDPLVSLFWSIKLSDDDVIRSRPLDEWKRSILELCPRADFLLSQIDDWSQVLTARYGDVGMNHWHDEGVVVIGDAGHAMSPQLGQGVNLALADASCLARNLAEYPLNQALVRYSKDRRWPLAYYRLASSQLTPWFQSDMEWLTPFRSVFFRATQRLPPARKFMTKTMAGLVGFRRL
ncbi:FAD-dependent oxidoreductase [Haloferula sp.]|uniref:FAD-dependent oxidoreductase n=1 Tax=Haloferula sp. TaxID=2497595 RepID=UPI003C74FCA6